MRSCVNCKYSRDVGPYLACYGQKNAPKVDWDYVCEDWKSEHITNADRLNAMTVEEKAEFLAELSTAPSCTGRCHKDYEGYGELRTFCHDCWLEWLQQEVDDDYTL